MGKITYKRPPLIEVSFGMFFAPLTSFRASHYGVLWDRLRPDFIETADRPVVATTARAELIAVADWFPLPRVWYVHKDGEQLLQLQPDRFYFNWRKVANSQYPRYEALEPLFFKYLHTLQNFVQAESIGALEVRQLELVYVNRIEPGDDWAGVPAVGEVFPDLTWPSRRALVAPNGVAWHGLFELDDMRLDADVKTARSTPDEAAERFLQFELRATSQTDSWSADGFQTWFRKANEIIVSAFSDLTSEQMQKEAWGRADN